MKELTLQAWSRHRVPFQITFRLMQNRVGAWVDNSLWAHYGLDKFIPIHLKVTMLVLGCYLHQCWLVCIPWLRHVQYFWKTFLGFLGRKLIKAMLCSINLAGMSSFCSYYILIYGIFGLSSLNIVYLLYYKINGALQCVILYCHAVLHHIL